MGRPHRHQGRRDGREGDRAPRQVREHGGADGEGGRLQDLGRRGRRDHHRDRAGARDLHRGRQAGGGRARPDEPEARRGPGRDGGGRGAQEALQVDQGQGRDRPGRHRVGQRRPPHRRHDRRGDGEGREGGRHHGRGGEEPRHAARGGRGHAVRPRLLEPVLRHRPRAHGGGARGRLHPDPREEDLGDEGSAAVARADITLGEAAAGDRGGGRGRGPGHPRRQQDPRHAPVLRRQGPGLRGSPEGHAGGHRHPDRRPHDRRSAAASGW